MQSSVQLLREKTDYSFKPADETNTTPIPLKVDSWSSWNCHKTPKIDGQRNIVTLECELQGTNTSHKKTPQKRRRASLGLVVLLVFAMLAACAFRDSVTPQQLVFPDAARFMASNPEASQSNLVVISHLLSLKFSNSSMRLLGCGRQRVHPRDSGFPQFAPRDDARLA
ncbi:hypothetical protein Tco_1548298 [Tanacetum coccineum]